MNRNDKDFIVQKIRTQYTEKQSTELDALRELDAKVKLPANVFAYTFGSVSAIVMGAGMSLIMTDIGAMIGLTSVMVPGIAIGIVGMVMALVNYPIYKNMLAARRKKYAGKIIELSEKIMNESK
ncbi:MAG: dihydropteridine reductase [Clostridia bacterium]|nr:dihydropteridine reductase [Clostridia bacterium]